LVITSIERTTPWLSGASSGKQCIVPSKLAERRAGRAKPHEVLSQADREEFERTTSLLPVSVAALVAARRSPLRG